MEEDKMDKFPVFTDNVEHSRDEEVSLSSNVSQQAATQLKSGFNLFFWKIAASL